MRRMLVYCVLLGMFASYLIPASAEEKVATTSATKTSAGKETEKLEKIVKSEKEWRKQLSRTQFKVTRQHATEPARSGRYWNHKAKGTYTCVCCDLALFSSETKFKSGTGWPSFYAPVKKNHIGQTVDRKLFMTRMEVHCNRCDAHLGHVFNDGPRPTGLRYCINSASLAFESVAAAKRKAAKKKREEELAAQNEIKDGQETSPSAKVKSAKD